jgi:hypothetical protein
VNTVKLGGYLGLAIGVLLAIWWLNAVQFALQNGFESNTPSVALLDSLWLTRALAVALLAPALALWQPRWSGFLPAALLLWSSLPLVVLAAAAAGSPWRQVSVAEFALLGMAACAFALGLALRHWPLAAKFAEPVSFCLGLGLAAMVWAYRGLLLPEWAS